MNWLDWVLIVGLVAGAIKGFKDGLINQVVALLALALGILFAGLLAQPIKGLFSLLPPGSINDSIASGISYILAFIVIMVIILLLGKVMNVVVNLTPAIVLNKGGGILFGVFGWALMLSLVLNLVVAFDVKSMVIKERTKQESFLYAPVKGIVPAVFPFIRDFFNK